jgi:O-acetyl-ADP-ribose deacetylase (regulator of RNase III)
MVRIREVTGNLFSSRECLAHCVSSDFHMGAGIAVQFKSRFGGVSELLDQRCSVGQVAYLFRGGRIIFYLVTKARYFHRPTLAALRSCLCELARLCRELRVACLSIPRLGCGLDGLVWEDVKREMYWAFQNMNSQITVFVL